MADVTIKDLLDTCHMEILIGHEHLDHIVIVADINRPGLALAGYLEHFDNHRVQVTGMTELAFLDSLVPDLAEARWAELLAMKFPCLVVTRGLDFPENWLRLAEKNSVPVLRTTLPTTSFIAQLTDYLEHRLAPNITMHATLVDVHGVGVLITGESGIGKSETALELVYRGHRLVADDAVEIAKRSEKSLVGRATDIIRYLIEVRGLGILNVKTLFGTGAVRFSVNIDLVIRLEEWQPDKYYDRLGLDEETAEILGVIIPQFIIPVRPGRNIAAIVDVAAMNYRRKTLGYIPIRQFAGFPIDND